MESADAAETAEATEIELDCYSEESIALASPADDDIAAGRVRLGGCGGGTSDLG